MAKVIILTHGGLAHSLYETVGLIIQGRDDLEALGMDADTEGFKSKLRSTLLDSPEEDFLILVDLFGGTPFNMAASMLGDAKAKGKRVEIVSGVNLPMLLDVTIQIPNCTLDELKQTAIGVGKMGIRDLLAELNDKKEVN